MTRNLLALAAAATVAACALPEPTASTAQAPYQEKETITGSRIPAKSTAQGTKKIEVSPLERDEIFRPKANPLGG